MILPLTQSTPVQSFGRKLLFNWFLDANIILFRPPLRENKLFHYLNLYYFLRRRKLVKSGWVNGPPESHQIAKFSDSQKEGLRPARRVLLLHLLLRYSREKRTSFPRHKRVASQNIWSASSLTRSTTTPSFCATVGRSTTTTPSSCATVRGSTLRSVNLQLLTCTSQWKSC